MICKCTAENEIQELKERFKLLKLYLVFIQLSTVHGPVSSIS